MEPVLRLMEYKGLSLADDMRSMLDDPALGDIVLVSKDGDRLRSSRIVLAARSCFFYAMLTNGVTLESQSSEIALPSITTCGLLPTLEFLYAGSLARHAITVSNVIDVIHASRFLLLSKLQLIARSFFDNLSLDELTRHRGMLLTRAVQLLTPDCDFYTSIFTKVMTVMPSRPQDLHDLGELSFAAMCFYLQTTRNAYICILSSEYFRLRLVLMWCARSISIQLEEVVKKYLPPEQSDFLSCTSAAHSAENRAHLELLKSHQSSMQECFEPFLDYLDLFQVHPEMLARVVEPMGTIPHAYLTHVFRFHAMFSKDMLLLRWGEGAHHPSYAIREEGSVLEHVSHNELIGFGRTDAPVASTTGIYEWDIIVERHCSFMGIGFCSTEALSTVVSDSKWLGYSSHGWFLCCHGYLYHSANAIAHYAPKFGRGSRVRVHVDFPKGTCSFTVNGTPCGVAWTNIPSKIFPAVSMRYPGRVRIEFAWTEDKKRLIKLLGSTTSE